MRTYEKITRFSCVLVFLSVAGTAAAQQTTAVEELRNAIDRRTAEITDDVVAWRRDIHEHPELGNREFRTAELIAEHVRGSEMAHQRTLVPQKRTCWP